VANAMVHRSIGGLAGLAAAIADTAPESEQVALMAITTFAGLAGAMAPDVIEPALSPNHRAFFHSLVTLAIVTGSAWHVWNWKPETFEGRMARAAALGFLAGYVSHLALDATTPMSLPIV
jgi:inner membrane protein